MDKLDDILQHHGIKGMKWGVIRKKAYESKVNNHHSKIEARQQVLNKVISPKKSTNTTKLIDVKVKLKSGETLSVSENPTPALGRLLGRLSSKIKVNQEKSHILTLKDSHGKDIGEMQLFKESKDSLNIVWVDVNESHRGKGYGTGAMEVAINYAKQNNLKKVTLEVPGTSPEARHIYEKLGFKSKGLISDENDIWGGLTEMELDLKHTSNLDDILQHHGIKGMKWGVIRKKASAAKAAKVKSQSEARQRALKKVGAKIKSVGKKNNDGPKKPSLVKQHISSMKREHQWSKALSNIDKLTTKDINRIAQRAQLENDLKRLASKKMVGSKKHKQDYLNRAKMSDQELQRKVNRLRAIDSLHRNAKEATRAQREFGKKVVSIAGPLTVQYALTKSIGTKDILNAVTNPNGAKQKAIKSIMDKANKRKDEA